MTLQSCISVTLEKANSVNFYDIADVNGSIADDGFDVDYLYGFGHSVISDMARLTQ